MHLERGGENNREESNRITLEYEILTANATQEAENIRARVKDRARAASNGFCWEAGMHASCPIKHFMHAPSFFSFTGRCAA